MADNEQVQARQGCWKCGAVFFGGTQAFEIAGLDYCRDCATVQAVVHQGEQLERIANALVRYTTGDDLRQPSNAPQSYLAKIHTALEQRDG